MIFCISAFESITIIFFFFYNTPTTEIYTLSLHDALPISVSAGTCAPADTGTRRLATCAGGGCGTIERSEEHTSELQSRGHLVCRLLLEKKKSEEEQGIAVMVGNHIVTSSNFGFETKLNRV